MRDDGDRTRESYDVVARDYATRIYDELDGKPLDRALLGALAERVDRGATVCDAGCGPGHVTAFLRRLGVDAVGVDLSPGMVAEARRLNPSARFRVGDIRELGADLRDLGAIVSYYSIIHFPREEVEPCATLRCA